MTDYCSRSDLYDFGVPRGAIPNPGRLALSVLASTDRIKLDVHGFETGTPVTFRAESGGSLPPELVEGATYYTIEVNEAEFSVSATEGGAPLNFSVNGTRVLVISPLPVAARIAWASRLIDDMLPAHLVPLTAPVPEIVRITAAELAAYGLGYGQGAVSKTLTELVDVARKRLERWAAGVPIRGENAPEPAGLAASASVPYSDARGWNRYGSF